MEETLCTQVWNILKVVMAEPNHPIFSDYATTKADIAAKLIFRQWIFTGFY